MQQGNLAVVRIRGKETLSQQIHVEKKPWIWWGLSQKNFLLGRIDKFSGQKLEIEFQNNKRVLLKSFLSRERCLSWTCQNYFRRIRFLKEQLAVAWKNI
jgi:hypothetical protein